MLFVSLRLTTRLRVGVVQACLGRITRCGLRVRRGRFHLFRLLRLLRIGSGDLRLMSRHGRRSGQMRLSQ